MNFFKYFVFAVLTIFLYSGCVTKTVVKDDKKEKKKGETKKTIPASFYTWKTKPVKSKYETPVDKKILVTLASKTTFVRKTLYDSEREKLVKFALKFNGKKVVPGRKYRSDCSGYVRMVFDHFGVDIFKLPFDMLKRADGSWLNGTEVVYKFAGLHGKNFKTKLPLPGDFIYFDNTHDRNKDGKLNDWYTHIGIVVSVDKYGTVKYIHRSSQGMNIQYFNLKYKNKTHIKVNGKKIKVNSWLRGRSRKDSKKTPHYSGQMVRGFGSIFLDPPVAYDGGKSGNSNKPEPDKTKKDDKKVKNDKNIAKKQNEIEKEKKHIEKEKQRIADDKKVIAMEKKRIEKEKEELKKLEEMKKKQNNLKKEELEKLKEIEKKKLEELRKLQKLQEKIEKERELLLKKQKEIEKERERIEELKIKDAVERERVRKERLKKEKKRVKEEKERAKKEIERRELEEKKEKERLKKLKELEKKEKAQEEADERFREKNEPLEDNKRGRVVNYALSLKGRTAIPGYPNSASGFVRKVFRRYGLDILNLPPKERVDRKGKKIAPIETIYWFTRKYGNLYTSLDPEKGDLIFFDNSLERNRSGKNIDKFTHIAIIYKIDKDKTLHFIHYHKGKVRTGVLNKKHWKERYLEKKLINSYLRTPKKSDRSGTKYLSSEFLRRFGKLFK